MDSDQLFADRGFIDGVRRFVSTRVPSADADDVLQNVFLRAHDAVAHLRDEGRAEAWMLAIARKAIADYYRKRSRDASVPDNSATEQTASAVPNENLSTYAGDHDVHEEVMSWLRPAAEQLPEPYRSALIKTDFEGIPQNLLARALHLSESGLKSRVQRARAMLGDKIQNCCEIEFGGDGRAIAFHRLCPARKHFST